jgi:hypothetical protein
MHDPWLTVVIPKIDAHDDTRKHGDRVLKIDPVLCDRCFSLLFIPFELHLAHPSPDVYTLRIHTANPLGFRTAPPYIRLMLKDA